MRLEKESAFVKKIKEAILKKGTQPAKMCEEHSGDQNSKCSITGNFRLP